MSAYLDQFEKALDKVAKDNDLEFKRCSEYHFHLKGVFLVNVYPTVKTFYIQGTNGKSRFTSLNQLVELAKGSNDKGLSSIEKGVRKQGKSRRKRRLMWEAGQKKCWVCGVDFVNFDETTLEHKIPLTKGGSNRRDNLALSHYQCNQDRGNSISIKKAQT